MQHIFLIFFIFVSVQVKNVDAFSFYEALNENPGSILLDVSPKETYLESRIPNAFWAGEKKVLDELTNNLDRKTPVFIYCSYGERTKKVVKILKRKRFRQIYVLDKGFTEWTAEGLPIDTSEILPEDISY